MNRKLLASLFVLSLAACGGGDPAGKSTTKLDAVEVQPGSVSDSMIILDDASIDGTAVDNSVPDDGTKKDAAKKDDADTDDEAATDESAKTTDSEAVVIPSVKKAVTADPAAKKSE